MVIAAVVLMAAAGLVGFGLHRQATGTHQRLDAAAEMRAVGESYLQLAMAGVNRWANEEGGPTHEGVPLHDLFRRTLLEAGAPARLGLELPVDELLPDSPWAEGSRFQVEDGEIGLVLRRARHYAGYDHQGGGLLEVSFTLQDSRGELDDLKVSADHRYTVLVPSLPRPFDEFTLLIKDPRELVREYDAGVRDFSRQRDQLRRDFRTLLRELADVPAILGELHAARADLESLSPLDEVPTVVPRAALSGGAMMVARPEHGAVPLAELAVGGRLDAARDEVEAGQRLVEEARRVLEELQGGEVTLDRVPELAAALRSWGEQARASYDTLEGGLGILQEVRRHVRLLGGDFARRVREHWSELSPSRWARRAHFVIEAASAAEAAEELRELGGQVSPLNGVVRVVYPADEELVLTGSSHGLQGRFVLVAEGRVALESFRPQDSASTSAGDATRAVVLARGDVRLSGPVQAAVVAHGAVDLDSSTVLYGALVASRIEAPGAFRGELRVLPESGWPHRFSVRGDDRVRRDVHFVAIDPVPSEKRSWFQN
jgi:hypothetical protein